MRPGFQSAISGIQLTADWMLIHKPIAHPYDEQAFSPLGNTAWIGSPLALCVYVYVCVYLNQTWMGCFLWVQPGFEYAISISHSSTSYVPDQKLMEVSRIKSKNLNSIARPYIERAFNPFALEARVMKDAYELIKKECRCSNTVSKAMLKFNTNNVKMFLTDFSLL